jgi:hypothetical protein
MKLSITAYLRNFFLFASLAIAAIVTFNLIVDPYGVLYLVNIKGMNQLKPKLDNTAIYSKAAAVRRLQPRTIIVGSSRVAQGIDPRFPELNEQTQPPRYNLGTDAASMYRLYRYVQHAQSIRPLQKIILVLDFFSFNSWQDNDGNIDDYVNITYEGEPQPLAHLREAISSVASMDALMASIETLRNQNMSDVSSIYLRNGFRYKGGNTIQHRRPYFNRCRRFIQNVYFPRPRRIYGFFNHELDRSSFTYLNDLLALTHENQIAMKIAIAPPHAYLLETIEQAGLWRKYEDWKRALVTINQNKAASYGVEPYDLWDFSGYNSVTTQSVPDQPTPDSDDFFYFESSHFKPSVGSWMMERLFSDNSRNALVSGVPDDFGVQLSPASIEQHLESIRDAQAAYRRSHSQEVEGLRQAIAEDLERVERGRYRYRIQHRPT